MFGYHFVDEKQLFVDVEGLLQESLGCVIVNSFDACRQSLFGRVNILEKRAG